MSKKNGFVRIKRHQILYYYLVIFK